MRGPEEGTHRYSPCPWLKGIITIIRMSMPLKSALRFMKSLVKRHFLFFLFFNDNFYRNNPKISWIW